MLTFTVFIYYIEPKDYLNKHFKKIIEISLDSNNTGLHLTGKLKDSKKDVEVVNYLSQNGINNRLSSDLIAIDIREALSYLGEITGKVTTEDLLGNIFANFCIRECNKFVNDINLF